jgi:predicted amidohydrolase
MSPGNHPRRFLLVAAAVFIAGSPDDDPAVGLEPGTGPAQRIDARVHKAEIFQLGLGVAQDLAVPVVARSGSKINIKPVWTHAVFAVRCYGRARSSVVDAPAALGYGRCTFLAWINRVRITSIQLEMADQPKAENVAGALSAIDRLPAADLVLLPEIWPCGFFAFDRYAAESESLDGPTVSAFRRKARERRCHLVMGSLVERDGEGLFNTTVFIGPDGEIIARYRKIHLFGYQSDETKLLTPGQEIVVVDTPWGRTGFSTCYDLRFPELFRRMVDRGAEIFFIPSAWPLARIEAWRLFNRARAHENLAFLVSCNCAGENSGKRYGGHSMVVDPWGRVLAEGGEGAEIVTAEVDVQEAGRARAEFPALADRVLR